MKYSFLFFSALLLLNWPGKAQSFQSHIFKAAVNAETRTQVGYPGERYFQNKTAYTIRVHVNPKKGMLEGEAELVYHNNSPDTLRQIVFRLYQDMRKKGGLRDNEIPTSSVIEGVEITSLIIDEIAYTELSSQAMRREGTNLVVNLRNPVNSGQKKSIHIAWNYQLPADALHRFGKYKSENHFIAYWYPQIAVYDDLNGWDLADFTDTQEFYNDFNSYDVTITVPKHQMVWATGEWQNPDEVLSEEAYKRYTEAQKSDHRVSIIDAASRQNHSWMQKRSKHTYHFLADSITDFAFALSDSYVWDGASVLLDSIQGKRVTVFAAYNYGESYFNQVVEVGCKSLQHFATTSYGVSYPFRSVTVFNGQGGMEFPMLVNDGTRNTYDETAFLTMHELAHAYFPFLVGINERQDSWIDEGLTTYLPTSTEQFLQANYYPIKKIVRYYERYAGTERDIPLHVSAMQTRGSAYQYYTYMRSSMAFYMLEELMGTEDFRAAIREFILVWQYKHPTPYDLFNTFKKHTQQDIDWLIDQWFHQPGWPDLSLDSVIMEGDSLKFLIKKTGNFAVPAEVIVYFTDDFTEHINIPIEYWKNNEAYAVHLDVDAAIEPKRIILNLSTIPDKNRKDNVYEFPE